MFRTKNFNFLIILILIGKFLVEAEPDEDYVEDINELKVNEAIRYIKNQNEDVNLNFLKQKRSDLLFKKQFNPQTSIIML